MAAMTQVETDRAPAAVGPYSQGIAAGPWVFVSGQIGMIPGTGELAGPAFADQARQALENLGAVIEAAGCQAVRRRFSRGLPHRHGPVCRGQRDLRGLFRRPPPGPGRIGRLSPAQGRGGGSQVHRPTVRIRPPAGVDSSHPLCYKRLLLMDGAS